MRQQRHFVPFALSTTVFAEAIELWLCDPTTEAGFRLNSSATAATQVSTQDLRWFVSSTQRLQCRILLRCLTLSCCCRKATHAEQLLHSSPGQVITGLAPYDIVICCTNIECYDETTTRLSKRRLDHRMAQSARNHRRSTSQQSALPASANRVLPEADLPSVKREPACNVPLGLTPPVTNSLATPEQADLLQVCTHHALPLFIYDALLCCSSKL